MRNIHFFFKARQGRASIAITHNRLHDILFKCHIQKLAATNREDHIAKGVGKWGLSEAEATPIFFQPPTEILNPSSAPPFKNYYYSTTYCTKDGLCRHLLQANLPNFCNFVTKVNEIAKTVQFFSNFVCKPLGALL